MIQAGGRINKSAYELMSKMLQILTLSYPNRENNLGPQILVLFTNLSKQNYDEE